MENETLAQKALRLLSTVPKEDFINGRFSDGIGKCCAIGHFERLTSKNSNDYSENNCVEKNQIESPLRNLSNQFLRKKHNLNFENIATVNNYNDVNGYTEPEIKDRVIHLLTDMVGEGL